MSKLKAVVQAINGLDADGHEVPDPTPLTLPAGFKRPETLADQVQRLVRTHLSRIAAESGAETFEESEDFDVGDEQDDPRTPYEAVFDPVLGHDVTAEEFRRNQAVYRQRALDNQAKAFAEHDRLELLKSRPASSRKGGAEGDTNAPSSNAGNQAAVRKSP